MSFPTPLNPWYIVARENDDGDTEYYTPDEESKPVWTRFKARAFIHMGAVSADRTKLTEPGSWLIALTRKEELKEWGRG